MQDHISLILNDFSRLYSDVETISTIGINWAEYLVTISGYFVINSLKMRVSRCVIAAATKCEAKVFDSLSKLLENAAFSASLVTPCSTRPTEISEMAYMRSNLVAFINN